MKTGKMHKKSASASGVDLNSLHINVPLNKDRTHTSTNRINCINDRSLSNSNIQNSQQLFKTDYVYSHDMNNGTKNEVDLIEILGGQWPTQAGNSVTPILNSATLRPRIDDTCERSKTSTLQSNFSSSAYEKNKNSNLRTSFDNSLCERNKNTTLLRSSVDNSLYERNKSANFISHLISNKKKVELKNHSNDQVLNREERVEFSKENCRNVSKTADSQCTKSSQAGSSSNVSNIYDIPERRSSLTTPEINEHTETHGFSVGSLVEVEINNDIPPLYGVIRWIGSEKPCTAGVELEDEATHLPIELTDGTYNSCRYFTCTPGKALFVPLTQCRSDQRFLDMRVDSAACTETSDKMFGQVDCPVVKGTIPPLCMQTPEQAEEMCGKFRGIQGHHNSCYLDATLFAMFACTSVMDSLLFRPPSSNDIEQYQEVQRVLREEIVNPLRQNLYVRADRVMKLRTLLEKLSSVSGLTSEEKDPEEFLNSLLAQILRAEPFLKLSSGQEAFYYQLFVEKDERLALPSVQQLFEQSFLASNIKLKEVPSCLIIQMPRFGKTYKMYPRIIPSLLLDVTDVIEDSPRQCTVCGGLALYECLECIGQCGEGLESTAFCSGCLARTHVGHASRALHHPTPLHVPHDFRMVEHCSTPPRLYMELFAVVCIETSHYVCFVKCGSGHEAPWCFFDSMADRKGERYGYNIPEIVACPGLAGWLSEEATSFPALNTQLPEPARRLLSDAYLCLYQSSDVMMYR